MAALVQHRSSVGCEQDLPAAGFPGRIGLSDRAAPPSDSRPLLNTAGDSVNDEVPDEQELAASGGRENPLLMGFCLSCLFSQYLLVTFLSPFLPKVASQHGVNSAVVGVIMAADSFATFVASPIIGFKMSQFGVRRTTMAGLVLSSATCGAMSCVPSLCNSSGSLTAAFVGLRLLMGSGGSLVETAVYSTLLNEFPKQRGKVMAASETVVGIGCIAGPPFGGIMYQLGSSEGSFETPCIVFATFPMILCLMAPFCIPTQPPTIEDPNVTGDSQVEKESSIAPAVLSAPFIITLSGVVLSSSALGFIDPVLSPYMQDTYGVDTGLSGVFFMIPGVTYILSAMVAGAVVDTFGGAAAQFQEAKLKRVSAAGFALLVLAYLFMAPAFARDALERLSVFTVALVALGVGVGLTIIPTLSDMQSIVERHQANNGRHTDDVSAKVSGIWGSAYGLGSAIGPIAGGALEDSVGINWASFIFGIVCAVGLVLNIYGAFVSFWRDQDLPKFKA